MNRHYSIAGREQTPREEVANSVSHGIGMFAALIGAFFLIKHAVMLGDPAFIVGCSVFAATMVMLYMASSLYHALPPGSNKAVFLVIEHSGIFLLIAGTYTPLTLGVLYGPWGWLLLGIVWGLAFIGITLKILLKSHHHILFTSLYLLMGWTIVIAIEPLMANISQTGLFLLVAGGLSYTVGVIFFATDSALKYGHFVWHLFVIGGTTCHYFAVLGYKG
ncbi:PAQR family membrane homeostasis protein TrhA [Nitrincola iocasae]|uniref:Hemolysin III family protein n=1 Tax=Nitrincola iocasae TaxID=2614693 RepID=A0A5J6LEC5_9GAMM|nr:hemolysin III family protein [Nitrincola iocasae]QEW06642.1 hemolysin III family protein [Nitrincola iocasae]